jgi:hypothetical protein
MKKRALKHLSLSRETLYTLSRRQSRAVLGVGPSEASACKQATDCVACTTTNDPDLCQVSWAGNCYTYTC